MKHHAAGLRKLNVPESLIEALTHDPQKVEFHLSDRAMLDYALKLTREPAAMKESDVEALRKAGFTDAAILDINLVTGYFAFVNRLADGLGVPLEDFWK